MVSVTVSVLVFCVMEYRLSWMPSRLMSVPHDAAVRLQVGMKCVALAGRHPVYELAAADLVVRDLSQLSFVNLKRLFAQEQTVARQVCVGGGRGPAGQWRLWVVGR